VAVSTKLAQSAGVSYAGIRRFTGAAKPVWPDGISIPTIRGAMDATGFYVAGFLTLIFIMIMIFIVILHGNHLYAYSIGDYALLAPDASGAKVPAKVPDVSGNVTRDTSGNTIKSKHTVKGFGERIGNFIGSQYSSDMIMKPYAVDPINDVDDYEYSMVFRNEGDRAMTKETRNFLMSQYPMDWSTQPPSSDKFQSGLASFKERFMNPPSAISRIYDSIDGSDMNPPDSGAAEEREREILATYTPKDPQDLSTYSIDDAKELIDKIYTAKGMVPEYEQTGDNQFTVYSVRPIGEPVYEDDPQAVDQAPASRTANAGSGEDTIVVPSMSRMDGADPFFTPGEKTRDGRWDYTSWTPGLERMFAPNAPMKNWY
jgi:hypothetical protein